jgi:hypothetical protein
VTVHRVWLYRHASALVCVDAASPSEARLLAAQIVRESDWIVDPVITEVQPGRKDWPLEVYWTGPPDTGRWTYPETELFDEGEK